MNPPDTDHNAVITLTVSTGLIAKVGSAQSDQSEATTQNRVPFINQPLVPDAVKPGGALLTLTVTGLQLFWSGATSMISTHRGSISTKRAVRRRHPQPHRG
jgi:hypothetical protein